MGFSATSGFTPFGRAPPRYASRRKLAPLRGSGDSWRGLPTACPTPAPRPGCSPADDAGLLAAVNGQQQVESLGPITPCLQRSRHQAP